MQLLNKGVFMRLLFVLSVLSILMAGCAKQEYYVEPEIVEERYVHKYGVDVPASDWAERGKDGEVHCTLDNGVKIKKTYVGGVLDGETTHTFPHSEQIQKHQTYSNGDPTKEVIYYITGTPQIETITSFPSKKKLSMWYQNGTNQSIENYEGDSLIQGQYFTKENKLESSVENGEGIRTLRDKFGLLLSSDKIEKGVMTSRTIYYSNGHPKDITPMKDGVADGIRRTFQPDGAPLTAETWVNGKQSGLTTVFQNGEKYAEVPYVNGVKEGVEQRFKNEKDVIETITWVNNERYGATTSYIGDTTKVDWYLNDRKVTQKEWDMLKRG